MKSTLVKEKVTLEAIGKLIDRSVAKLATKDEIAKLATKDEIAKLATRDEMNIAISKLATKDDISGINDRLSLIDKRFDAVDGKLLEFTGKFARIDERFDALERKVDRMDSSFSNQLDYFHLWSPTRKEFTELDDRMKKVEKKLKV